MCLCFRSFVNITSVTNIPIYDIEYNYFLDTSNLKNKNV